MVWIDAGKLHIFAQIVVTFHTQEAFHTRYARLYGNSVTRLQVGHSFTALQHLSCRFMAQDVVTLNYKGTNSASLPKVDV